MTGSELFIFGALKAFLASSAVKKGKESLASEMAKSVWNSSAVPMDQLKQAIFNASGQYISSYADRHGILKVLGMMEPIWMEDIFTTVQVVGFSGIRKYLSLEDIEKAYRETQRRRLSQAQESKKQDGLAVANEQAHMMVLGQPGAGKSTFLRRIGLEALRREDSGYRHNCIPVFLELKRFNTGTVDIEQAIAREFETCNFPDPARSAKRLLEDGKLLVLLDGLDEVPTQQIDQAITQIQDFCDRYKHNRFIASCRTAAYHSHFRQFCDVIMADFDDEKIQQFITNWFRSKDDREFDTAQKCWELLQQQEYTATRELAQTPLLLTFLCLVFDDAQTFPKQRAFLYKDALDVLLKRWAAEKRIQRDPIYQDLTLPLEEIMLAEIAYTGFANGRLFFAKREVVEQIRAVLVSNLNAPQHLDGEDVLDAIQIQQGILVDRARNILSFSHLTLQEYLTAQHIADNNLIESLATDNLCDQRWREVFLLVAGLVHGGADALLLRMQQKAHNYLTNSANLQALIHWVDQATIDSTEDFNSVAKRSLALYLYLDLYLDLVRAPYRAFDRMIDRALTLTLDRGYALYATRTPYRAIDRAHAPYLTLDQARACVLQRALDYTRELEKTKIFKAIDFKILVDRLTAMEAEIPPKDSPVIVLQAFVDQVLKIIWCEALALDLTVLDLSEAEVESLNNYLYANELMVRCKEAAVRVSPQVWAGIEERMLTIRG